MSKDEELKPHSVKAPVSDLSVCLDVIIKVMRGRGTASMLCSDGKMQLQYRDVSVEMPVEGMWPEKASVKRQTLLKLRTDLSHIHEEKIELVPLEERILYGKFSAPCVWRKLARRPTRKKEAPTLSPKQERIMDEIRQATWGKKGMFKKE